MRTTSVLSLAALLALTVAAPFKGDEGFIGNASAKQHESGGQEYVVLFNSSQETPPDVAEVLDRISLSSDHSDVKYTFNNSEFKGFVANMKSHCIDALNAMVDVAHVEETVSIESFVTQQRASAPWGLQRVSSASTVSGSDKAQTYTYSYDDNSQLGKNVDIYIVDTGVRTSHAIFGKRARSGFGIGGSSADGDGHGTHVAGTAAGAQFGIASNANIYAVKVLGDDGSGSSSDTIAGMNWVINNHNTRKTQQDFGGSIMSMSWGLQGVANTVDQVVLAASNAGIHISVAAGNDATDACKSTPAHNGGANSNVVSVGAVNIKNAISSFSNTGSCVDIYAPGENIISSWNTGDAVINNLSGTSMACPHVTGVMAYLMAQDTNLAKDPAALKKKLLSIARTNVLPGGVPLLSNGVDGGSAKRWVVVEPDNDVTIPQSRGLTGWARGILGLENKRWSLHSREAQLRY